jgi:hypothetical protein
MAAAMLITLSVPETCLNEHTLMDLCLLLTVLLDTSWTVRKRQQGLLSYTFLSELALWLGNNEQAKSHDGQKHFFRFLRSPQCGKTTFYSFFLSLCVLARQGEFLGQDSMTLHAQLVRYKLSRRLAMFVKSSKRGDKEEELVVAGAPTFIQPFFRSSCCMS